MSRITSWGTAEDGPEREAMRALLIGRSFMAGYREARGRKEAQARLVVRLGQGAHRRRAPVDVVQRPGVQGRAHRRLRPGRGRPAPRGHRRRGPLSLDTWFRTDISERFGWLFEPACLEYDGWKLVELRAEDNSTRKSWTKPTSP